MTREKKLKRQIRARARKTGERYTAARRQVLLAREKRRARATAAPAAPATIATAAAAAPPARGEAGVIRRTGHGYDHWFAVLDRFGAVAKGHTASAAHLVEAHGVPGWHAQMITVAFERARGLRAVNQRTSGRYEVSVSKTLPASVAAVAAALRQARARSRWVRAADPDLARAMQAGLSGKDARPVVVRDQTYARTRYRWDATTVQIHVYARPNGASIVATNEGLPDAASVERRRAQWRAAFDALTAYLSAPASRRA
jgi:hypothetical protein